MSMAFTAVPKLRIVLVKFGLDGALGQQLVPSPCDEGPLRLACVAFNAVLSTAFFDVDAPDWKSP